MKNFVLGLTAICGFAAAANAEWGAIYQFNTGSGWVNNAAVDVSGGNVNVQFRVVAYVSAGTIIDATGGPGPAAAFNRYVGSERLSNFGGVAGDGLSAQTRGQMTQSGGTYLSSSLNAGVNTILGNTQPTSFASQLLFSGTLAQYCPSSGGTPVLQWTIRTGTMTVSQLGGTRTITFGNNQRTGSTWYRDLFNADTGQQDVNSANPSGSATDIGGTLEVVPAPGSLALLGLGGLAVARRRRA